MPEESIHSDQRASDFAAPTGDRCHLRSAGPRTAPPAWRLRLLLFAIVAAGCSGPPTLHTAEAFATADALYTAVTSRRPELLDEVETQLNQLHSQSQLSDKAKKDLDRLITNARAGEWQRAAEELDDFIRRQPHRPHAHAH